MICCKNLSFAVCCKGWAGQEFENPVWVCDSFTQYTLFDSELKAQASEWPLYCCGFTDDAGKTGFVVVADRIACKKVELQATPCLYNLDTQRGNMQKHWVLPVDTQQALAARGRIRQQGANTEVIVLNDGEKLLCV